MDCRLTKNGRSEVRRLKRQPAFEGDYDVVVIGLGTAGAVAFRTATKAGLRTFGIERLNGMGGLSTLGIVCFGGGLNQRLDSYEREASGGAVAYESVVTALAFEGLDSFAANLYRLSAHDGAQEIKDYFKSYSSTSVDIGNVLVADLSIPRDIAITAEFHDEKLAKITLSNGLKKLVLRKLKKENVAADDSVLKWLK